MGTIIFTFIIIRYPCSINVTTWQGPGTHKGPSAPHHHPVPLHFIRPFAPHVWPATPVAGLGGGALVGARPHDTPLDAPPRKTVRERCQSHPKTFKHSTRNYCPYECISTPR